MPFHPDPAAVSPESGLLERLAALSRVKGNKVVINSGRDRNTLNEWLGELGIDIAAEHGVWIKKGDEWSKAPNLTNGWKQQLRGVLNDMVERTPGSFVEEKEYSIAWHYRRVDRDFGERRVREFRDMLRYLTANLDLQVLEGNKVVEIKNAGVNKGHATLYWVNEDDWDFIMAIGDDHTDEDIFKALPESAYSIKVGRGSSAARFQLPGVEEVRDLLTGLANV
jgi:trehalose 6-phosphate synthase/phosphatase